MVVKSSDEVEVGTAKAFMTLARMGECKLQPASDRIRPLKLPRLQL